MLLAKILLSLSTMALNLSKHIKVLRAAMQQ